MLNFDMVGYKGEDSVDVCISSDKLSNHDQSLFLVSLMNQYLPHLDYRFFRCRYACSDHASWTENNFPATMVHECPRISPHWHKDSDLVKNINADYMSNFARLGLSYVAELAKRTTQLSIEPCQNSTTYKMYEIDLAFLYVSDEIKFISINISALFQSY